MSSPWVFLGVFMNQLLLKPLFDFFHIPYPGIYLTMLYISFFLGFPLLYLISKKLNLDIKKTMFLPFFAIPGALEGSKIFHFLFDEEFNFYVNNIHKNGISYIFTVILNPFSTGHVFFGGLLGGSIAGISYAYFVNKKDKNKVLLTADVASFPIALGLSLTRIGCFFNGCCFGIESRTFGIHFPANSVTSFILHHMDKSIPFYEKTPPLIPTQIIHSVTNLAIFLYLIFMLKKSQTVNPGFYFRKFLILYSIGRFFIEFLRFDPRGHFLFFSTSQWISLLILASIFILDKKIKKNN